MCNKNILMQSFNRCHNINSVLRSPDHALRLYYIGLFMGFFDAMRAALVHKFIRHIICGKILLLICFLSKIIAFWSEGKPNQEIGFWQVRNMSFQRKWKLWPYSSCRTLGNNIPSTRKGINHQRSTSWFIICINSMIQILEIILLT